MSKAVRSPKTDWHPLSLQQLTPNKFILVVNHILAGQYSVLPELLHEGGNGSNGTHGMKRGAKS